MTRHFLAEIVMLLLSIEIALQGVIAAVRKHNGPATFNSLLASLVMVAAVTYGVVTT